MALVVPQTPLRAFPGAYLNTPALSKTSASSTNTFAGRDPPILGAQQSASQAPQPSQNIGFRRLPTTNAPRSGQSSAVTAISRAERTIDAALDEEAKYPAFDNYVGQGYSSEYDIPSSAAWSPFQRLKSYQIPDKIFEQTNNSQVSTMMGLFADIHHAWIAIDNALYLWDYTLPNPMILGFEEQPNNINAVKMVIPRPGVFVSDITRLLVVATVADINLIGVAMTRASGGGDRVVLYQTRMQVSVRGIDVQCIAGSAATGRIFFAGTSSDDVYELTYQQEEKWFQNKCAKINHTTRGFHSIVPVLSYLQKASGEHVKQLVIDDSRSLLYTLSSQSSLRVFSYKNPLDLSHCLTRNYSSICSDLGHRVPPSDLFTGSSKIISLSPITAREASRISLMATTNTGCRIFFSTVSGAYYGGDTSTASPPTSMQVYHVKFPPSNPSPTTTSQPAPVNQNQASSNQFVTNQTSAAQATTSQSLSTQNTSGQIPSPQGLPSSVSGKSVPTSKWSERFPPGYFLCCVAGANDKADLLFMSTPDSGRIAHPQDPSQANKYPEFGLWVQLQGVAEDIGLISAPFSASASPMGFGNELAVQFDRPATEIAILTNYGIFVFIRRRLVDIFAATIRHGGGDEGLEAEVKSFVRMYGRGETIATALAVACGQGFDVSVDSRLSNITDSDVLEQARKTFIEHGGKPVINENSIIDQSAPAIDSVRPSPRHEGLALYISRILRSVWNSPVLSISRTVQGGLQYQAAIPSKKLADIQHDLTKLQEFLNANRTFIEGLAGPEALSRVSTKQEEIALQGEHQALNSLVSLIAHVIEGISFVIVLIGERLDEIMAILQEETRQQVQRMTFKQLFCSTDGRNLAKELVKAIVNSNISHGTKIEAVTDSLRRTCGGFCSPDDCDIFKGQELIKRASDKAHNTIESSRNLLNDSLKLLQRVAGSLTQDQLNWTIDQYIQQEFFAGAIQLALSVAQERDRGNSALAWLNGSIGQDVGHVALNSRTTCYNKIHEIIMAVDRTGTQLTDTSEGLATGRRIREAYDVINNSQDEVFQINLYDWYLSNGWSDRLLSVESSFVESYLRRKLDSDLMHADLLWQYYAHNKNYLEAAQVQVQLAKSSFDLPLDKRIEYFSRARANASTQSIALGEITRTRQSRQELIREVSDYLDVANIQVDLLQRMKGEARLQGAARERVLNRLNGAVLTLSDLFQDYIDQAAYHDLSLVVYQAADYRNPIDIRREWQALLQETHEEALKAGQAKPYEVVGEKVRNLGARLQLSESTFPIPVLLPLVKRYSYEQQRNVGAPSWVIDTFLDLSIPYETLVAVLESMFYADEPPFKGRNRRFIAADIIRVVERWFMESSQAGKERLFGGEENAAGVVALLGVVEGTRGLEWSSAEAEHLRVLKMRVDNFLRS